MGIEPKEPQRVVARFSTWAWAEEGVGVARTVLVKRERRRVGICIVKYQREREVELTKGRTRKLYRYR